METTIFGTGVLLNPKTLKDIRKGNDSKFKTKPNTQLICVCISQLRKEMRA
jgi:hypothetical protein